MVRARRRRSLSGGEGRRNRRGLTISSPSVSRSWSSCGRFVRRSRSLVWRPRCCRRDGSGRVHPRGCRGGTRTELGSRRCCRCRALVGTWPARVRRTVRSPVRSGRVVLRAQTATTNPKTQTTHTDVYDDSRYQSPMSRDTRRGRIQPLTHTAPDPTGWTSERPEHSISAGQDATIEFPAPPMTYVGRYAAEHGC